MLPVLPEMFRGSEVQVIIRETKPRRQPLKKRIEDTSVYALKGLLKGKTEEELESAKDRYLTEKYVHDDDID